MLFSIRKNLQSLQKKPQNEQLSLNNRYDALFIDENINDNDNDFAITSQQNENVTKRKERKSNKTENQNNNIRKKVVAVIGDSMIKHIKGHKLSNKNKKVVVKTFPGAKVDCMKHYVIPTLQQKPEMVIIHCGTNDLKTKEPNEVSESIVDLAKMVSQSNENTAVVISGIVRRGDALNEKAMKVNEILEELCNKCNIGFIDNGNIDPETHLNKSKLHLNVNGTNELENNLRNIINC